MKKNNFYKPYMYMQSIDYNQNELNDMYPDIYWSVYPHVQNVIDDVLTKNNGSFNLTENMINEMCSEVINRSGIYMNSTDNYVAEAAAYPGEMMRRNDPVPFRNGRGFPGRRDNIFLNDIIRILLLKELFGRRRR